MSSRFLTVAAAVFLSAAVCYAGGPAFVAGSGYNAGVEGQPLVWASASVEYFTDQGDLSPILPGAQADAFVAAAISPWTSAPGVGLTATQAGHLAEDVNGGNIEATVSGVITAPADISSSATTTPLGIVYDYDGTVTDAVLGEGAGSLDQCFANAVYGGPDNFAASGNIVHALVIINGVCAATSSQLPEVQYRLVRALGRVFGLGWSQANVNVQTGNPVPTTADYAGFPVMHFFDSISCAPITVCYPNPAVPNMDDVTALARLYPEAGGNPQPAGRIWGNLYFTDSSGNATQQMQGVNVVARLMVSGQPSRQYVVTSVSGFEFVGNAGNIITGDVDANGLRFDRFGSNDTSLEGFFDLGQLTIPTGQTIAEYQLSVEAIDPNWSWGVEPYGPTQVVPSGTFAPVVVTVTSGSNVERDILMLESEIAQSHPGTGSTYTTPAVLPLGGGWGSWLSGYGATDWFEFTAQANRTASVAVTALDEAGNPTESKLLPIIGIWELSDQSQSPAPASTPSAFNSLTFGTTRLDAQFNSSEAYRMGIADYRGDGRPDYSYQASVLYSDTVTPARLSLAGGVTTLQGIGFNEGLQVTTGAGASSGVVLSQWGATQMQVSLPAAAQDGLATIQVTDPANGSFSQMLSALTYGAAATDILLLVQGTETSTPVGAQAAYPIRVRATASDGLTPVNGATLAWSATNGVQLSACSGNSSCSVLTDESGETSTWLTPIALGQSTITAALAPASYSPAQKQQATLVETESILDLAALAPTRWLAQGATTTVPLTVEALDMGVPKANVPINYTITQGTASLTSATATTNNAGLATVTAQLTNLATMVQVSACVAPANSPCQTFTLFATPASMWKLEPVGGTAQVAPTGQPFQPLIMRVTDGSTAANPLMGTAVTFVTTLERNPDQAGNGMPIILGTSQTQVATDQNGLASIIPTVGSLSPCDAYITVTAGGSIAQFELESVVPITATPEQPVRRSLTRSPRRAEHFGLQRASPPDSETLPLVIPEATPSREEPPSSAGFLEMQDHKLLIQLPGGKP
ncbi:MAG: Ig-like domain-containing protein [Terriglobales bacterium]